MSKLLQKIYELLKPLIALLQQRNALDQECLQESRDLRKEVEEIEENVSKLLAEQAKQTSLIESIAAEIVSPTPGAAAKLVLTLGTQVPQ